MFNQNNQEDERINFQDNCNNDLQNTKISSQGLIITEEENQFLDKSGDAFKINQICDVQEDHQKCEYGLSQIQNNYTFSSLEQSIDLICFWFNKQKEEINTPNLLQNFEEKSNIINNVQVIGEEIIQNQDSGFIDKNEVIYIKAESKNQNQNQKIETIKEQMDHIDHEYQDSLLNYQEIKQKELSYLKQQSQIKLNEIEKFLYKLIKDEESELIIQYKKQNEAVNNILEQKKQIIQQQLDEEIIIQLEREKMQMAKKLEDDLEHYKQQKLKSNQSKLTLLQQKLYLHRLISMKKLVQQNDCDINTDCQIKISEKKKHLQNEFNQYRIQQIESIEQNIQLLDQFSIVLINLQKAALRKDYNQKSKSQKNQLKYQIIQQQNKKKLIDNHIKQIFENQLIVRRNIKEQLLQEEIKNIQQREFKLASYVNLDIKDKEVKQIKIDNLKQCIDQKQRLNDRLSDNFQKLKGDLQVKYQQLKSNLVEQYIEKLEKQKSLHENNRQHRLILEVFQETNKKQKFIDEISENIQILENQKYQIEQSLAEFKKTTDTHQFHNELQQKKTFHSDLEYLNDHIKQLKLEDQKVTKELDIFQRKYYKLISNHQQKQCKSQIISFILQSINELNDGKTDLSQEILKFSQQEQVLFKTEGSPQFPVFVDNFDELNLKQMKKWKAFLLNQRIIWIWEDEMCQREQTKLKSIGNKLNKDISEIKQEFQQQNIIKKENEFRLIFLEKQGQILKYQQSQIVNHEQKANFWRLILRHRKKILDKMNLYTSNQFPIQKSLKALEKLYTQYIQIQQDNDNLPQEIQVEDLSKYKFQLPSQYSFLSQKQNNDLQYILLI